MTRFTKEDRLHLERELSNGRSFREISAFLGVHPTSVSREVRRNHIQIFAKRKGGCHFNDCAYALDCTNRTLCRREECPLQHKSHCKYCSRCSSLCPDYLCQPCPKLSFSPYVCNACDLLKSCHKVKRFYDHLQAHTLAFFRISEPRKGLQISPDELRFVNQLVSPGIKNGQSLHHVCEAYKDQLPCCEKSVYNLIYSGLLDCRKLDLPRAVRFRPRTKTRPHKVNRNCRVNRSHADFLFFMEQNPDTPVVQIDSVIGRVGGSCMLTLYFTQAGLLLIFQREHNTAKSVCDIFNQLEEELGRDLFRTLFPVLLTDNGSEFSDPDAIERSQDGSLRTRVFYCDPGRPDQKGALERSHEHIRRVLPKGSSFDSFGQEDMDRLASHINSEIREKLNNRTPIQLFSFLYGEETLTLLHLEPVKADQVCLHPRLLSGKNVFPMNRTIVSEFMREHLSFHEYADLLSPEEFESDILAQEDSRLACCDKQPEDENWKNCTI